MTERSSELQAILDDNRDDFRQLARTLEEAVEALLAGSLDEELRASAERDAHELAGSLGTFGLRRGSELASELEQRFAPAQAFAATAEPQLTDLLRRLREELSDERSNHDGSNRGDAIDVSAATPQESEVRELRRATFENSGAANGLPASSSGRILIVGDDLPLRLELTRILADAGYDLHAVGSAREARYMLEHDTIALLLSDVSMPGEAGLDLIRFAGCDHPHTATLLISAREDPGIAQLAVNLGVYGYLSKPVGRSEVLIGVMNALRRRDLEARERAARDELERTATLRTSTLSPAVERLQAEHEHGRVLQAEAIHRWAQSVERRDPSIGRHVKRMSGYCAVLGRALGLDSEWLGLASVLHDVGKLAIPDSIALKPGLLTADERLAMETHAEVGYEMLRGSSSSILELAAVIARTHHEKYDGSGYPRGLSGTDIPMEGRIAAVADVFDAMTCDRVYRPAWSLGKTSAWMKRERGKHFDPTVLDAFNDSTDEIMAIRAALTSM